MGMIFKWIGLGTLLILGACGGGGGGGGTDSQQASTVYCINSQVSGCSYSISDPTQTNYGWWNGTRTVGNTTQNAYLAADSLGNFEMYIGTNFTTGYLQGTSSIQGSVMGLTTGNIGNDAQATTRYSPYLSGNTGGVITQKIMRYSQSGYSVSTPMTMSFTYNAVGDAPLSSYVGNYVSGASSLNIASNGDISATYPAPLYIPYNNTQTCSITKNVPTSTAMKNVVLSGSDSCATSVAMRFYHLDVSGVGRLVLRLTLANNQSPIAVVF